MTERLSTGLRNWLLDMGSLREAFKDFQLKIYSGSAPASADDEKTGILLATITKGSGTGLLTSRNNQWRIHVPATGMTGTNYIKFYMRYDPAGVTGATGSYSYKVWDTPGPTGRSYANARAGLTQYINNIQLPILSMNNGQTGTSAIMVSCKVPGDEINIVNNATGEVDVIPVQWRDDSRGNYLWFGASSGGAISKTSDVWSGVIAVSGVAGYFRIVQDDDDGTLSTTQIRLQGAVSTSGAELNLSSTSLVAAATLTIDTFSISLPAE